MTQIRRPAAFEPEWDRVLHWFALRHPLATRRWQKIADLLVLRRDGLLMFPYRSDLRMYARQRIGRLVDPNEPSHRPNPTDGTAYDPFETLLRPVPEGAIEGILAGAKEAAHGGWRRGGKRTAEEGGEGTSSRLRSPRKRSKTDREVARTLREVLHASHDHSGMLVDAGVPDERARARVKLILERPRLAEAYVRMILDCSEDVELQRVIRMMDYYTCDTWPEGGKEGEGAGDAGSVIDL